MGAHLSGLLREIKAAALVVALLPGVARAQDHGCAEMPVLTPATLSAGDLRCFPVAPMHRAPLDASSPERTPVLPLVLGATGAGSIALAIGFGIGGASLLGNGVDVPASTATSVRIDYAITNVALSVGLTALATAIVLAIVHR